MRCRSRAFCPLSVADSDGNSLLHAAILATQNSISLSDAQADVIRYLISNNLRVSSAQNHMCLTALELAILHCPTHTFQLILHESISLQDWSIFGNEQSQRLLKMIVELDKSDMLRLYLDYYKTASIQHNSHLSDAQQPPVIYGTIHGDTVTAFGVASLMYNCPAKSTFPLLNYDEPMAHAARLGRHSIINTFIEKGVQPNAGNALHIAATEGDMELLMLLLNHGANVFKSDYYGGNQPTTTLNF